MRSQTGQIAVSVPTVRCQRDVVGHFQRGASWRPAGEAVHLARTADLLDGQAANAMEAVERCGVDQDWLAAVQRLQAFGEPVTDGVAVHAIEFRRLARWYSTAATWPVAGYGAGWPSRATHSPKSSDAAPQCGSRPSGRGRPARRGGSDLPCGRSGRLRPLRAWLAI